ncbi:MAG: hypothetical protein ACOY6K_05325, partial [Pseudomonadota bacterium]
MLPGFRFLFAAITLAVSLLVFGLGAAALLRAAHEQFVNVHTVRPPAITLLARASDTATTPSLSLLRVDPPARPDTAAPAPATAAAVAQSPAPPAATDLAAPLDGSVNAKPEAGAPEQT